MRSTIMNTSKEMSAFSDFPPPGHFPIFMHNRYTADYLQMYAQHFRLLKYVMFKHMVMAVAKAEDKNHWVVSVVNQETGRISKIAAQFLLICIGTNAFPNSPTFPGMDEFHGPVSHSHSYKHANGSEEKTVLVVGSGNSGLDVAVELSHVCKKVYLSVSHEGCWVLPRLLGSGYPLDMLFIKRFMKLALEWMPRRFQNAIAEYKAGQRLDHRLFGFHPKRGFYDGSRIIVNDEVCSRLASGTLVLKGEVDRFIHSGVVFKHDSCAEVHDVDAVILATGYTTDYSFLEDPLLRRNIHDAYKFVFPMGQSQPTIALVGHVQTPAPTFPVSEMQARWAVQTFLKRCTLPPDEVMHKDALQTRRQIVSQFGLKASTWPVVNYISYMDFLAKSIGVKPTYSQILFRDPCLFVASVFGPFLPYQFRLQGLHAWTGARDAILEAPSRIRASLQTRSVAAKLPTPGKEVHAVLLVSVLVFSALSIGFAVNHFL